MLLLSMKIAIFWQGLNFLRIGKLYRYFHYVIKLSVLQTFHIANRHYFWWNSQIKYLRWKWFYTTPVQINQSNISLHLTHLILKIAMSTTRLLSKTAYILNCGIELRWFVLRQVSYVYWQNCNKNTNFCNQRWPVSALLSGSQWQVTDH